MTSEKIATLLRPFGLVDLGLCPTQDSDGLNAETIVLVGPDEPRFWPIFTQSAEYADGHPNPLDRWSRSVLTDVAGQLDGAAVFPSDGPPFLPFQSWALRTGRFWASPIGFLVHETGGLFASFRGALTLPFTMPQTTGAKPCDTCVDHPCASACPVSAFADGYDVAACKTHLNSPQGTDCMTEGCRARRACPVGQGNRLPAQAAFHMEAFL